jgi:hypothetical protein
VISDGDAAAPAMLRGCIQEEDQFHLRNRPVFGKDSAGHEKLILPEPHGNRQ